MGAIVRVPPEFAERVGALYELGHTYAEIGTKLNITKDAVAGVIKRMRMRRARPKPLVPLDDIAPLWAAGHKIVIIAAMLGTTPSAISSRVDHARSTGDTRFPFRCEGRNGRKSDAPPRLQRPCITCGYSFLSEGSGNRMCGRCRIDAENMSPLDPGIMESRGRRVTSQAARVG